MLQKIQGWFGGLSGSPGKTIEMPEYALYIPSKVESTRKVPLVVALSPGADAGSLIRVWEEASEKYQWIIFASKTFSNEVPDMEKALDTVASSVENLFSQYPIDPSRIVASGLSGGAMGSHALSFRRPDLVRAVVANTGMIHEMYLGRGYEYPRGRLAVFLASPTDFRYYQMQRDKEFLDGLGWRTQWIEFNGGHCFAPSSVYCEAAAWLSEQFGKW